MGKALSICDLPPPPPHKTGWPWTEACPPLPPVLPSRQPWPRISIVTPSYNQGVFLEATLRSVLLQGYPNLEYVVIDGGSRDDSVAVLQRYEKYLDYWTSEKDRGHAHALNKGFAGTTGTIMAWLNSDDLYLPDALRTVAEVFTAFPELAWLTSARPAACALDERAVLSRMPGFSRRFFARGGYLGFLAHATGWIQQESTFWRRSLWEQAGGYLDESYKLALDCELWCRFFRRAPLTTVEAPLGCFRTRADQRSVAQAGEYVAEALRCLGIARPTRLEAIATRYRQSSLAPRLNWRRIAQGLYGERVPVISFKDGAWQKKMKWLV